MLTCPFSHLMEQIEDSANDAARLIKLRVERRADPNFKGCGFCFDTAYGELEDGAIVPCPKHNGLCV